MAVHARGYRPYAGPAGASRPWLAIARDGLRIAWRGKALKRIGVMYLVWFAVCAFILYLPLGTGVSGFLPGRWFRNVPGDEFGIFVLRFALRYFYYPGISFLTALLAVLVGSGLMANDVAAKALPLYLVRPIRTWDYVLGKALVIPAILLVMALLPGLLLWLLAGFWQDPGQTGRFLTAHLDVPLRVLEHFVLAAAGYTGLVLLLSVRTARRTAVAVLAAGLLVVGTLLRNVAVHTSMGGTLGALLRHVDLPRNTAAGFQRDLHAMVQEMGLPNRMGDLADLPSAGPAALVSALLLGGGLLLAWRRARTVEVTS